VAGSCEYGDEPSSSGTMQIVNYSFKYVARFKYLEMTETNQYFLCKDIKQSKAVPLTPWRRLGREEV
jgi:hypothetical protein